jgi:hypothetical protein
MMSGVLFRLQPVHSGGGPVWLRPLLVVVTFVVLAVVLRFQAGRRTRALPALVAAEGAQWAGLVRVMKDGRFFDRGRGRRGGGPRGTLISNGTTLEWRPDAWETRHGDVVLRWKLSDVRFVQRKRTWDIMGVRRDRVELLFPEGSAELFLIGEYGRPPANLTR